MGQDYQPIMSNHVRFYDRGQSEGYDEYGIKIDSIAVNGTDSIYYNYLATRDYNGYGFGGGTGECDFKQYSWVGNPVIVKNDGWTYFVNQDQDSIKVNHSAQLAQTWPALQISSNSIVWATVTNVGSDNILGIVDNVKTIEFNLYHSNGQPLSHYLNGTKIKIGETLGLVEGLDLYHFPNYIEDTFLGSFPLTGIDEMNLGIRRPGTETLFEEFEVGDEFAYKVYQNIHQPISTDHFNYLITVIQKTTLPQPEYTVVIYESATITDWDFTGITYTTSYSIDTAVYNNLGFFLFYDTLIGRKMPSEMFDNSGPLENSNTAKGFTTGYRIINDSLTFSHFATEFGNLQEDGCINDYFFEFVPWNIRYAEHLGAVYATTSNAYDDTQLYLTYLKRGNSIYGTPITVSQILSVSECSSGIQFPVYPNPVGSGESIDLGSSYQLIELLDMSGKSVLVKRNKKFLRIENLSSGIYLLKLRNPKGISTQKLIVTH